MHNLPKMVSLDVVQRALALYQRDVEKKALQRPDGGAAVVELLRSMIAGAATYIAIEAMREQSEKN